MIAASIVSFPTTSVLMACCFELRVLAEKIVALDAVRLKLRTLVVFLQLCNFLIFFSELLS